MAIQQWNEGTRVGSSTGDRRRDALTWNDRSDGRWSPQRSRRTLPGERLAPALGWFSVGLGVAQLVAPGWLSNLIGVQDSDDTRTLQRVVGVRELMAGVGIFTAERPERWLWARVAGDVMDLVLLGAAFNARHADRSRVAMATASVVGVTALDLYTALQLNQQGSDGRRTSRRPEMLTTKSVVVNREPDEVYAFWHDFTNFPRFMIHLDAVRDLGGGRSHWQAKGPGGKAIEWDAELTHDRPNELIGWRSLPGADIDNEGSVRFERAPGGRGTLVRVNLRYDPPAGALGKAVATLMNTEPGQQVSDDLRRFKQVLETGEVMRSDASIHLTPHPARPPERPVPFEPFYEATTATRPAVRSEAPSAAWASDEPANESTSTTSTGTTAPSTAGSRGGAR